MPSLSPGNIVIMDNLSSYKGVAVRKAIRATGARLLFMPPHSPDLNPIKQVCAKLKLLLRKASARTFYALIDAIGDICQLYQPNECQTYFNGAGYRSD